MKFTSKFKNSVLLAFVTVIIFSYIFNFELLGLIAVFIFFQQLFLFVLQISNQIPFRSLFGLLMALQTLFGPAIVYNGLEEYQYQKMAVSQTVYFSYVIPAILFFILGLNLNAKDKDEYLDIQGITDFVNENPRAPFLFIGIGFVSSFLYSLVSSEIAFVFYVLSTFKFIGLFTLILGRKKISYQWLILIYGSIILSSIASAMFFDLLAWTIFLGSIVSIKYRIMLTRKLIGVFAFILLAINIQSIKNNFREKTWRGNSETSVNTLKESAAEVDKENEGIFSIKNLAPMAVRINQGWIISSVLDNVPRSVPFSNGTLLGQYFEAAFLPRVLASNKLKSGDQAIFIKYSGIYIGYGTSMGLGSVSDAYINFGIYGGVLFMFLYGLVFNYCIFYIGKKSIKYPILILFSISIFFYPIRAECELQTILTHLVKSSLIIFTIFFLFKRVFERKNLVLR